MFRRELNWNGISSWLIDSAAIAKQTSVCLTTKMWWIVNTHVRSSDDVMSWLTILIIPLPVQTTLYFGSWKDSFSFEFDGTFTTWDLHSIKNDIREQFILIDNVWVSKVFLILDELHYVVLCWWNIMIN